MAQDGFPDQRQRFTGRAVELSRAVLKIVSEDVRTWDVFRWIVIVLLALNLLLLILLVGGLRSEIAELKQDRGTSAEDLAGVSKEVGDTKTALTKAMTDMRSGLQGDIAKISAKLDARVQQQPKPAAPPAAPKPGAKPKP
jgi:hypothetical protein